MTILATLQPALRAGLRSMRLDLDEQQQSQLLRHMALIGQWGKVYNLTAVREPEQMLVQHLLDSLAVVEPLRRMLAGGHNTGPASLLDVGSGAGLPGIPLAVACPTLAVTCVDAVGKKAGFIRQVGLELGLRSFTAVHARVEELPALPWAVVASRAFASLHDFVKATTPLLAPGGVWLAMKGKIPAEEVAELPDAVEVFHVEPLQIPGLDADRCIVWMRRRPVTG